MKSLNVLIVTMSLNYSKRGGLSRHTYELSRSLGKLGCEVYVSCMDKPENVPMSVDQKIVVPCLSPSFLDLVTFNMNLPRKTKDYHFDIIHTQGDHGFVFAFIKRKPLVTTVHGTMKLGLRVVHKHKYHLSPYFRVLTEKYTLEKADKIIVVANALGKLIRDEYGIAEEKIVYIPNAVDAEKFNPNLDGDAVRLQYDVKGPLLLSVARLRPGRFVKRLIPAMHRVVAEIPKAKLIVVGDGPLRKSLEKFRDQQGLTEKIVFVGAKDDDELPLFYAAADIVVLPIVFIPPEKEFTVLEAMASGKPVVYVNRIGSTKTRASGIIEANSERDFVNSTICLLQDEKKRKKLGLASRKAIVSGFSWEKVAKKTLEVYESLVQ